MTALFAVSVIASLLSTANCACDRDLITELPGFDGEIPYIQYSGLLSASGDGSAELFYWLVKSQNDPDTDPLVLWLNGGPGCSSLEGMLWEHGPLLLQKNGYNLTLNEWAWNKKANVIYLDSPQCVGFSPALKQGSCDDWSSGDDATTDLNFQALLGFLEKFPEFKGRDLYLAGESYAGVYIPILAVKIVERESVLKSMLKGIAIGNGLVDASINRNGQYEYMYTSNLLSVERYQELLEACNCTEELGLCDFKINSGKSAACLDNYRGLSMWLVHFCYAIDQSNILADCEHQTPSNSSADRATQSLRLQSILKSMLEMDEPETRYFGFHSACSAYRDIEEAANVYLNLDSVKEALHVGMDASWVQCPGYSDWTVGANDSSEDMVDEVSQLLSAGIRVLIYNGELDLQVPTHTNEWFVKSLGYPLTEDSLPWFRPDKQMGGMTKSYGAQLQYASVRNAGHMVPTDNPMAAYVLWEAFLNNDYASIRGEEKNPWDY